MKNTNTKTCTIENCGRSEKLRRGWCDKHYRRWLRYGDPMHLTRHLTYSPEEALEKKTVESKGCKLWIGPKNSNGYGLIRVNKKNVRVHRHIWTKHHGEIPHKKFIDHICHNRNCWNIKHLRLVTQQQNQYYRSGPAQNNKNSGVRNVYQSGKNWKVVVGKNKKRHRFGTYSTIEEAAEVAKQARRELFGEFAGKG